MHSRRAVPIQRSAIAFARGACGGAYDLDAGASEGGVERGGELRVAVAKEETEPVARLLEVHKQVPGGLGNPGRGRMPRDAEDVDMSGCVLNDEEHVDPSKEDRVDREGVAGQDAGGLGA
ncbi:hypothetical protein [Frankia nepalensis]|uniref:hypothetical protein n=1 Tax=Frankia nepalensis TaxID=1836974 RepID=UPI0038991A26